MVACALAVAAMSCFSRAKYDAAHEQRVTEIDGRYDQMRKSEDDVYRPLFADVESFRQYMIPIQPGASYAPVTRVSDRLCRHCLPSARQSRTT